MTTTLCNEARRVFFARFGGQLRPIQEKCSLFFGNGNDLLVIGATGAGKTEAVFAPLACQMSPSPPADDNNLRCLVISPTRALATQLSDRLRGPINQMGLSIGVETSDARRNTSATILIKTPEGLDAQLCKNPNRFSDVQTIVIDEIHIFLDSPRGTQLLGLLARLPGPHKRHIAISATLPQPRRVENQGFLISPDIVDDSNHRKSTELIYFDWNSHFPEDKERDRLLTTMRKLGIRKAIGFCRSKKQCHEVRDLMNAGYLKSSTGIHHGSLAASDRKVIERRLAHEQVFFVAATSTLEVGIDVGDLDAVLLFDAPRSKDSFFQQVGRSGRRAGARRALVISDMYAKRQDFVSVIASGAPLVDDRPFISGVLQQLVSIAYSNDCNQSCLVRFIRDTYRLPSKIAQILIDSAVELDYLRREEDKISLGAALDDKPSLIHLTFGINPPVKATAGADKVPDSSISIYQHLSDKLRNVVSDYLR